jgi:hypothetical protein
LRDVRTGKGPGEYTAGPFYTGCVTGSCPDRYGCSCIAVSKEREIILWIGLELRRTGITEKPECPFSGCRRKVPVFLRQCQQCGIIPQEDFLAKGVNLVR